MWIRVWIRVRVRVRVSVRARVRVRVRIRVRPTYFLLVRKYLYATLLVFLESCRAPIR